MIIKTTQVSPSKNESTAVAVPELKSTTFEKVNVEVPKVTPANGSTSDVFTAVRLSMQCSGVVPGMAGTIVFLENSVSEFTLVGVLQDGTPYEKGGLPRMWPLDLTCSPLPQTIQGTHTTSRSFNCQNNQTILNLYGLAPISVPYCLQLAGTNIPP